MRPLINLALRQDNEEAADLRELIPTVRYDARTVQQNAGPLERFAALSCQVLLLGGTRSIGYLRTGLDALSKVLPNARRVTFDHIGHLAADDSGKPSVVADELRSFFG